MTSKSSWSHIPGFKSWLRALVLTFSLLIPLAIAMFLAKEFTHAFFLALGNGLKSDNQALTQITIFLIVVWLIVVATVVPIFVLAHIHQFLWGEPDPKLSWWMPSNKSQIQGFWDWLVCVTSLILCTCGYIALHGLSSYIQTKRFSIPSEVNEQEAQLLTFFFFFVSAHLYHLGISIQTWFKKTYAAIRHWLDTV